LGWRTIGKLYAEVQEILITVAVGTRIADNNIDLFVLSHGQGKKEKKQATVSDEGFSCRRTDNVCN
jgi:hypothetical protein